MKIRRSLLKYRGNSCLNCKHTLEITDRFCSHCGQINSNKKLSFKDFFIEFFSGLFAYDSRLHRTIRALLFQPGKISKDYTQGKRIRYANPFRFYLTASILFFLIYSFTDSLDFLDEDLKFDVQPKELTQKDKDSLQALYRLTTINIKDEDLKSKLPDSLDFEKLEQSGKSLPAFLNLLKDSDSIALDSLNTSTPTKKSYKDSYVSEKELDSNNAFTSTFKKFDLFSKFYKETSIRNSAESLDSLSYTDSNYNLWLYKKAVDWNLVKSNPRVFASYFLGKLPFIIFFFLPIFAVFIWLIYIRRPFNYMEHLIFTFHVQTVFFILFAFAILFDLVTNNTIGIKTAVILFLLYLYKAMRNFYMQGRVKTILKFTILNIIFSTLAIVATIISLLASFAIY